MKTSQPIAPKQNNFIGQIESRLMASASDNNDDYDPPRCIPSPLDLAELGTQRNISTVAQNNNTHRQNTSISNSARRSYLLASFFLRLAGVLLCMKGGHWTGFALYQSSNIADWVSYLPLSTTTSRTLAATSSKEGALCRRRRLMRTVSGTAHPRTSISRSRKAHDNTTPKRRILHDDMSIHTWMSSDLKRAILTESKLCDCIWLGGGQFWV